MKLATSIPARKDGTVIVRGFDGEKYVFTREAEGDALTADVPHEETVSFLLAGGMFYPCDEKDYEQAIALAQSDGDVQEPPAGRRKRKTSQG